MDVTLQDLEDALTEFRTAVRPDGGRVGEVQPGWIAFPAEMAETIFATLSRMAALREPAAATTSRSTLPHWTEITRDELAAFLAKLRVGIEQQEDWKMGPTAMLSRPEAVADAIASHSHGLRLNEEAAEQDDVVDAHIHCEHAPASRAAHELGIADQIVALLGPGGYDGGRRVKRVLRWAWDYLTDGDEPPF